MTIAEELTAAANRLEQLARVATWAVWKVWGMEVRADVDGTSNLDSSLPVAQTTHHSGLRTFNADYIACMGPLNGQDLAILMRASADALATTSPGEQDSVMGNKAGYIPHPLLRIARRINGGTE